MYTCIEPRPDDWDLWCQKGAIEILVSFSLTCIAVLISLGVLPNILWKLICFVYGWDHYCCVDVLNCSDSHFCSEEVVPTVEQIHHSFGPTLPGRKYMIIFMIYHAHSTFLPLLVLSLSLFRGGHQTAALSPSLPWYSVCISHLELVRGYEPSHSWWDLWPCRAWIPALAGPLEGVHLQRKWPYWSKVRRINFY